MRRLLAVLLTAVLAPALILAACSKQEDTKKTDGAGYTAPTTPPPPAPPAAPPLTQAELEKWAEMKVAFARGEKTPAGQKAVIQKYGMKDQEWFALDTRVGDAKMAIARNKSIKEAIPAHLTADVELLRANWPLVEAAGQGKTLTK